MGKVTLFCSKCDREVEVEEGVKEVICWRCTQKSTPAPASIMKQVDKEFSDAKGFPKGWRWMKQFVHEDGRVFEKGEERKDLRGKLKPTPILTRSEKRRIKDAKELAKQAKLAQVYKLKRKKKK